jgi:hypothetical protein
MYSQVPVASDGFILNLTDLMLLFCKPYTSKFSDFHKHFEKINTMYILNDTYIKGASKIEKIDQEIVTRLQTGENLHFTGITVELLQSSSLEMSQEEVKEV